MTRDRNQGASCISSRRLLRWKHTTSRWVTVDQEFSTPGPCRKSSPQELAHLGFAGVDLAESPRGIIPKPPVALGRAQDFSGKEETRGKLKNVVVSYCRIGRISQASRVDGIAEDFNYFPVVGHKHDGLAFSGRNPYISISIQCDSGAPSR